MFIVTEYAALNIETTLIVIHYARATLFGACNTIIKYVHREFDVYVLCFLPLSNSPSLCNSCEKILYNDGLYQLGEGYVECSW